MTTEILSRRSSFPLWSVTTLIELQLSLMHFHSLFALFLCRCCSADLNTTCDFIEDCQNYHCPDPSFLNPADLIIPLHAFEHGPGFTQYQRSMASAASLIRQFGGCRSSEHGLELHSTLKYFCCYQAVELKAMALTIRDYAASHAFPGLTFDRIGCVRRPELELTTLP